LGFQPSDPIEDFDIAPAAVTTAAASSSGVFVIVPTAVSTTATSSNGDGITDQVGFLANDPDPINDGGSSGYGVSLGFQTSDPIGDFDIAPAAVTTAAASSSGIFDIVITAASTTAISSKSGGIVDQMFFGTDGAATTTAISSSNGGIADQFVYFENGNPECSASEARARQRLERIRERVAFAPDLCRGWNLPPNPTQADVVAAAAAAAAAAASYKPSIRARGPLGTRRR
jgi:hypothetical protein